MENVYSDTPHTGGLIFIPAMAFTDISASTKAALTRNAEGDFSLNYTAGGAETHRFVVALNMAMIMRLLEAENFQEQFGGSIGPAPAAGFPPFTGTTQLTPRTNAALPKGFQITDVGVVYTIGVVNLTSAALTLDQCTYVNGVANAVTNMPIAATALPLVVAATPYVVTRSVTTPIFINTDLTSVVLELVTVAANTGTIAVAGMFFHGKFNLN